VVKLEGMRLFELPTCNWQDNIKMSLRSMTEGCGLCSSGSGQELETGSCKNINGLSGSTKMGMSQVWDDKQLFTKDSAPWHKWKCYPASQFVSWLPSFPICFHIHL